MRNDPGGCWLLRMGALLSCLLLGGCTYERVVYDGWDHYRNLGESPQTRTASSNQRRQAANDKQMDVPAEIHPELNLRPHAGMFSLQIGFYDDRFGQGYRRAAEEAAAVLREQGHEAYFYHGPHRSMLTVGLFAEGDFVQRNQRQAYGPRIIAVQETFPHNLGNGRTLVEKAKDGSTREQPSFLVRVN